jgi:orotidine-5'-phosphate decarboxylase
MDSFGSRLRRAMDDRGPLCVGVDPHGALLTRWGLPDTVEGLAIFTQTVVDALAERVAVVKPQSAFFERFGSRGIAVLESTIRQFRASGALVLLDVKRGDIGSTMAAYASAYLDPSSPLYADAITASPFLGFDSLRPVIDLAIKHGGGVFVLALTSNPEGASVQRAITSGAKTVAQLIIDSIAQVNAGVEPFGSVGAVIGATIGAGGYDVTNINGPILVPGLGAQGGTAHDLRTVFGGDLAAVLPSYSREILAGGPTVAGLRAAAGRTLDDVVAVISAHG